MTTPARTGPNRRDVLAGCAALPLTGLLPDAVAPTPRDRPRVLVVVQLTGGNDGLNTVVPLADERYRAARPVLALGARDVHELDARHGLHPSLEGLAELWHDDALAIVHGVGVPDPDRSHFRSMEIWHTASTAAEPPREGWLGRLAATRRAGASALPIARVGGRDLPLALAGAPSQVPAIPSLDDLDLSGVGTATQRRALERLCTSLEGRTGDVADVARIMASAYDSARRVANLSGAPEAFGNSSLGRALALAAVVVRADLGARVLYVTQDGYDTHSKQAEPHASLLRDLDRALSGFHARLAEQGDADRVSTLVFSEFGRRVGENASGGTDHGAGNVALMTGAAVRGGIHGVAPDLRQADVPVTLDFRRVYASALDWLGDDDRAVLGGRYEPLPLFG